MNKLLVMCLVVSCLLAGNGFAVDYYVANQGNDNNDGISYSTAWQTIDKVNNSSFQPGDTIHFRCGDEWREQLIIPSSGTNGSPIRFMGGTDSITCEADNKPVISAATEITGWTSCSTETNDSRCPQQLEDYQDVYFADVPEDILSVKQLFVDDKYVDLAHYPDRQFTGSDYLAIDIDNSQEQKTFLVSRDPLPMSCHNDLAGAGIHIRTSWGLIEKRNVTDFDLTENIISWDEPTLDPIRKDYGYYLNDKICMLDQPGEWYYDEYDRKLYLRLQDESNPNDHVVEISRYDQGIKIISKNNIKIDGLQVNKSSLDGIAIRDRVNDTDTYGIASSNIEIVNVNIAGSGRDGIRITNARGVTVRDCNIEDSFENGLLVTYPRSYNLTVSGNTIKNSGMIFPVPDFKGSAVDTSWVTGATITNNKINSSGYHGITFGAQSEVRNNVIEESCQVLPDCGAIYTWYVWHTCSDIEIYPQKNPHTCSITDQAVYFCYPDNNGSCSFVYDCNPSFIISNIIDGSGSERNLDGLNPGLNVIASNGIYLDELSGGITVQGNTITGALDKGIILNDAFNTVVEANTLYANGKAQLAVNETQWALLSECTSHDNAITGNILFPVKSKHEGVHVWRDYYDEHVFLYGHYNDTDFFNLFDSNLYSAIYSGQIVYEYLNDNGNPNNDDDDYSYSLSEWRGTKGRDQNGGLFKPFVIPPAHKNDDSRILINKSGNTQDIYCPDAATNPSRCSQYIGLDNSPVDWPVNLPPFSSKIIVWNSNPFKCPFGNGTDCDPSTAGVYIYDNFDDGDDNGWIHNTGSWEVKNGQYRGYLNSDGVSLSILNSAVTTDNMVIETDMFIPSDPWDSFKRVFIIFDYHNNTDYKYIYIDGDNGRWFVGYRDSSGMHNIRRIDDDISAQTNYFMRVVISGNTVELYMDNAANPKISASFVSIGNGKAGYGIGYGRVDFNNFVIYTDSDADGYPSDIDCNDSNAAINPSANDVNCDGTDNNCNVQIDEGYIAVPTSCGQGVCASTGLLICQNGSTFDTCIPGTPEPEICDGIDNDCNAGTPDGSGEIWYEAACDGPDSDLCAEGFYQCINGAQICTDNTGDNTEGPFGNPACSDAIDNDCDGLTDMADSECPSIPSIPPFPTITITKQDPKTYHVDKNSGSDSYDGSPENPWATIQHGVNQLTAGDTLMVHAVSTGYREWVYISKAGTNDNWITIKGLDGQNGEKAFIEDYELRFISPASYILVENINVKGMNSWSTLFLNASSHHLAFDNIEIDCQTSDKIYTGVAVRGGVHNVWFRNMDIHHCGYTATKMTDASGVLLYREVMTDPLITDITFIDVTVRDNKGDGIGSTHVDSVYFDGCKAIDNTGDGFDMAAKTRAVFKNTVSADNGRAPGLNYQGVGIKAWSKETWLINSLVYNNYYDGVLFQPNEDNSTLYILNSTFIDDDFLNRTGYGTNQVYLYNNIFYSLRSYPPAVMFQDISRQILAGEDNNYYFSVDNSVAFKYKEGDYTRDYKFKEMGDGTWYVATGHGAHNIGKVKSPELPDPGFTSVTNSDYSLKPDSLAVDAGVNVGVDTDINRTLRDVLTDIGAYEYHCTDSDGDGYSPDGGACGVVDCNDGDDGIYPGGPPVRVAGVNYYSTLQAAYDAASDGSIIEMKAASLAGDLNLNLNKTLTLAGGYDCGYSMVTGKTTVNGNVTINSGKVTIENVEIQ